jgi:tetratricopeptide (TPR) repeat protein
MDRFRSAIEHLNAGRLDAAAADCAILCRAAPDDPAVLQLQAMIALRGGTPAEALRLIGKSLELRPAHVPSLIVAARAARAAGMLDQSAAVLREAIACAPGLAEPMFLLCLTLLDLDDPALAATVEQAGARFPTQGSEWQELGVALHRAGRHSLALTAFTRAVAADPQQAKSQFGLGLSLREAERMIEARQALQRAVSLDPAASGAWFALGLTCQDLMDEAGAAAAFDAALRSRTDFAEAAVNLGIARQRLGDMDGAIVAYRRAVRIRPDTFPRIAQAVTAAASGMLWLDLGAFRRWLGA